MRVLPVLLLAACLPKRITLPPPDFGVTPPSDGPTVALAYPLDARPPGERRDIVRYQGNPLPTLVYGDTALTPTALDAVDRDLQLALPSLGVPLVPWDDADYRVRVFVLDHAGRRDLSDGSLVATATGGLAGNVGQFVFGTYAVVEARLRLEVRDRSDRVVAVRDVRAFRVDHRTVVSTFSFLYLFQRSPNAEMFERNFVAVHLDLAREAARVVDEARRGVPATAGTDPVTSAYHTLDPWEPPDTLDVLPGEDDWRAALVEAKYGDRAFSVSSGQQMARGEVVGRIGAPTLGYDVGLGRSTQLLLDVTFLGEIDQLGTGIRQRLASRGGWGLALEERVGVDFTLFDLEIDLDHVDASWEPGFQGFTDTASLVGSVRRGDLTGYVRGGGGVVRRYADTPESKILPDLDEGLAWGPHAGLGVEYQLGPTVALSGELLGRVWFQDGAAVPGDVGPLEVVPQVTVGLR